MKEGNVIKELYKVIKDRKNNEVSGSYTNYLFKEGLDKILKKLGEENTEVIIAGKNDDSVQIINEVCDYIYHMLVFLAEKDISIEDIEDVLKERRKKISNKKQERREIQNY